MEASRADPTRAPDDAATRAIVAGCVVVAVALTCFQLSRPGLLFGVSSDIGVYLGGSVRLVHGALPYRDFAYLQPPGFILLASPIAFLSELIGTRDALAVLRMCTPFVVAANVALVGGLVRRRGWAATLVACGVMALFPAEFYSLRNGLLEPLICLFCLVGARLAFQGDTLARSRRLAAGGAVFGFAATIKAPAVLPALVVAALCLPDLRQRLLPFGAGLVAGIGIPTLPFFIASPGAFSHDVLASQFGRITASGRVPLLSRLGGLTGSADFGGGSAAAAAVLIVLAGLVITAFTFSRRRPTALESFAIGATVTVAVAQLVPAQYYPQYPAFVAPFLALLLGLSVHRLMGERRSRLRLGIAALAVCVFVANQGWHISGASARDVSTAVDAVIPAGGCAVSDAAETLITSDRFVSTVPGCTQMTDPFGTTIAFGGGRSAATVAIWEAAFDHSNYVVLASLRDGIIPRVKSLRSDLASHFSLVRAGNLLIFVRNGFDADADA
jgi:hypothetical protein